MLTEKFVAKERQNNLLFSPAICAVETKFELKKTFDLETVVVKKLNLSALGPCPAAQWNWAASAKNSKGV